VKGLDMNAVYDAAAARRRAVEQELTAANDALLAGERAVELNTLKVTALLRERNELDTWLSANAGSVTPTPA
jgi:hypothetical protein